MVIVKSLWESLLIAILVISLLFVLVVGLTLITISWQWFVEIFKGKYKDLFKENKNDKHQ